MRRPARAPKASDLAELRRVIDCLCALLRGMGLTSDCRWSIPQPLTCWAAVFNCSMSAVRRMLAGGAVQAKQLSRQLWMVALDDIPEADRKRLGPK